MTDGDAYHSVTERSGMFQNDSLFGKFMNLLFDVLHIGLLWLLCSVPLITMGTATTAAYYTMAKCVRYKSGYVSREFWGAFRKNFRQTIGLNFLFLIVFIVLAADIWYVWHQNDRLGSSLFMGLLFIVFLVVGICIYLYPILSRFYMKSVTLIKSSFIVMFKYLPVTLGLAAGLILAILLVYLMNWMVFILPGLCIYGLTYPMEWILRKMMPEVSEDSEEAKKWYYQ